LRQADVELLHNAVVAKCDLNDGIKDGLIGDPRACQFDPSELRCRSGRRTRCLTAQQIEGIQKVYRGATTSKHQRITLPAALRGSESTWSALFVGSSRNPTDKYKYLGEDFRYSVFRPNPGPTWKPEDFDFDRDFKRMGMAENQGPANPDLRRFKESGGKLLLYTGWGDPVEGVLRTVDYYESAERIIGSRAATQDFFRLFVIPGMNHCTGGNGAFAVDYLSYVEAWVEQGEAPVQLIGSHLRPDESVDPYHMIFPLDPTKVEFSRPVYPYPTLARYRGSGDQRSAASFEPVEAAQQLAVSTSK
jgi:hypothetical protein